MSSPLQEWRRLREQLRRGAGLSEPQRIAALEKFREELVATCGEEPTIEMVVGMPVRSAGDLIEVSLADYFGWFLKSRHGAVYMREETGQWFQRLASFGDLPEKVSVEAVLPRWLEANGLLIRPQLDLSGLTAEESERLLQELDQLGAQWVFPVDFNETLCGFLAIGPSLRGEYDGSEAFRLSLYGMKILNCLIRHRRGLPSKSDEQLQEEGRTLWELKEVWGALKPSQDPVKVLVLDEEPETVEEMAYFLGMKGLEALCATREKEALELLSRRHPHILLLDFSVESRLPTRLLKAARVLLPNAILLATTTARNDAVDKLLLGEGVRQIFRKPCRLTRIGRAVLEAAISVSLSKDAFSTPSQRCLIVDDEPEATEALEGYFKARGFWVRTAPTGQEALQLADEFRPDLILLDLRLPGINGSELLRQIRDLSPESKVVVLTAWLNEYPEETLKRLRPDAYAFKPVAMTELDRLVDEVLPVAAY